MKSLTKVVGYNLLAILLYSAVIRLSTPHDSMSIVLSSAVAVGLHVVICLLVAVAVSSNGEYGRAWLLSAGIVLLVGFSVCWGNSSF